MRIQNALLLLISIFKHKKRKEVCIKARSPLASHSLEGCGGIKPTTVKWSIQIILSLIQKLLNVTIAQII